jgi:hypothetical protein
VPTQIPATGADDALEARWWPFAGTDQLQQDLQAVGGRLYAAHLPALATAAYALLWDVDIHGPEDFSGILPQQPAPHGLAPHLPDSEETIR